MRKVIIVQGSFVPYRDAPHSDPTAWSFRWGNDSWTNNALTKKNYGFLYDTNRDPAFLLKYHPGPWPGLKG